MSTNEISLIVLSCDKYSDLWDPFEFYFNRNWPDCPFEKYFVTNFKKTNIRGFNDILIGEDLSWSDNLKSVLNKVETNYSLIMLDDLFINKKVNTPLIIKIFDEFKKIDGKYLKLNPQPKPETKTNEYFGEIKKGSLYRATVVFTIWKNETLKSLLLTGENPWEFEEKGTLRSDRYNEFYSTSTYLFNWLHGVVKGKYLLRTVKTMKNDGYDTSKIIREKNSIKEEFLFNLRDFRHKFFNSIVPPVYRRTVKKIINH